MITPRLVVCVTIFALTISSELKGQNFDWSNTTNTNNLWQSPSNWTPSGPPTLSSNCNFNSSGTYTVLWDQDTGNRKVGKVSISNGNVTFQNNSPIQQNLSLELFDSFPNLNVSGGGSLTVRGLMVQNNRGMNIENGSSVTVEGSPQGSRFVSAGPGSAVLGGRLQIMDGGLGEFYNEYSYIETDSGLATVSISGSGSRMLTNTLFIARFGNADVKVENGGLLQARHMTVRRSASGFGVLTVTGQNSLLSGGVYDLTVGGRVNVNNGATVRYRTLAVASDSGTDGEMMISGSGSRAEAYFLRVGSTVGNGYTKIENGAFAQISTVEVGNPGPGLSGNGTLDVIGAGTVLDVYANMVVGGERNVGTLNVRGGALVSVNFRLDLGRTFNTNSTLTALGVLNVSDTGSQFVSSKLRLGYAEQFYSKPVGRVNLYDGGRGDIGEVTIGDVSGNSGTGSITIWNNGEMLATTINIFGNQTKGEITVGNAGSLVVDDSILVSSRGRLVIDGGELRARTLNIQQGEFLMTSGRISVDNVIGSLGITGGTLAPGESPGTTTVTGNLLLGPASVLEIEIGGLTSSEFDSLTVTGNAQINEATLDIQLANGFQFSQDDEFMIFTTGGLLAGQFEGLSEGDTIAQFGDYLLKISYLGGNGNDIVVYSVAVPEPTANIVLGIFGLICVSVFFRGRRISATGLMVQIFNARQA